MIDMQRPVCELLVDHEPAHRAHVDGVVVEWTRDVDPEAMLLPPAADDEFYELARIIKSNVAHGQRRCDLIAQLILDAGFRRLPPDATVLVPAPEDGFDPF